MSGQPSDLLASIRGFNKTALGSGEPANADTPAASRAAEIRASAVADDEKSSGRTSSKADPSNANSNNGPVSKSKKKKNKKKNKKKRDKEEASTEAASSNVSPAAVATKPTANAAPLATPVEPAPVPARQASNHVDLFGDGSPVEAGGVDPFSDRMPVAEKAAPKKKKKKEALPPPPPTAEERDQEAMDNPLANAIRVTRTASTVLYSPENTDNSTYEKPESLAGSGTSRTATKKKKDKKKKAPLSPQAQTSFGDAFETQEDEEGEPDSKAVLQAKLILLVATFLSSALAAADQTMILPSLYAYLDEVADGTYLEYGTIVAAFNVGQLFGAPLFSLWSDKGYLMESLIVCTILSIAGNVLYVLADDSANLMAAGRLIAGFGASIIISAYGQITKLSRRGPTRDHRISLFGWITHTMSVLAPGLGTSPSFFFFCLSCLSQFVASLRSRPLSRSLPLTRLPLCFLYPLTLKRSL